MRQFVLERFKLNPCIRATVLAFRKDARHLPPTAIPQLQ
jgi:hypothetical protein